ncbi:MAG: adenylate/guanylate cyclase domain-containing protein [Gordonia sp. (in: high G+C Gram-positive bacteria)]
MIGLMGNRDYGSILLGSATESRLRRRVRIQTMLTATIVVANFVGAVVAIGLSAFGIPQPTVLRPELWWVNFIVLPVYVAVAFIIGIGWGTVAIVRDLRWSIRQRRPSADDARRTQRVPLRLLWLQSMLWLGAVVLFTILYGVVNPMLIPKTIFVTSLSGVVVVGVTYLLIEFALRPVAAELINAGYRRRRRTGVRSRSLVAWVVGSGTPIMGILLVVTFGAFRDDTSKIDLFVGVFVLATISLATGLLLTVLTSESVTGPIRSVRRGMDLVQSGDLGEGADLVVYDGTELGDLQAGFNAMVGGLREREHMRDVFGRHVGREVAEAALASDPELGGTERVVAALFVDIVGSTALAAQRSPTEVVAILNRFFAVIVGRVEAHRGLVNKFEGDAVLAIFGAPITLADAATAALMAAREIAEQLVAQVPELSAGIGVGYGPVVAGNVGAIERFEYTVIGDPVNESARLSELAKDNPLRPLASGRVVAQATRAESARWEVQEATLLRGRAEPTQLYAAITEAYLPRTAT